MRRAGALVLLAALPLAGCTSGGATSSGTDSTIGPTIGQSDPSGSTGGATAGATSGSAPAESSPPAEAVPAVLQFSSPVVGGGTFEGASVAGKPAAFWFWAPT